MVAVILDAVARILEQQGSAALTTNRIAEVAGVSVGTYYQYFPNKAAAVAALTERHMQEMREIIDDAWGSIQGETLEFKLRTLIFRGVAMHLARPALQRELDVLDARRHLDAHKAREDQMRLEALMLFEAHRDELIVEDIPLAVTLLRSSVKGVLQQVLAQRLDITAERLTEELLALCLRYLTGRDR